MTWQSHFEPYFEFQMIRKTKTNTEIKFTAPVEQNSNSYHFNCNYVTEYTQQLKSLLKYIPYYTQLIEIALHCSTRLNHKNTWTVISHIHTYFIYKEYTSAPVALVLFISKCTQNQATKTAHNSIFDLNGTAIHLQSICTYFSKTSIWYTVKITKKRRCKIFLLGINDSFI